MMGMFQDYVQIDERLCSISQVILFYSLNCTYLAYKSTIKSICLYVFV